MNGPNYSEFMRNSMEATTELLQSIDNDIQESRKFLRAQQVEQSSSVELIAILQEDNSILKVQDYSCTKQFFCLLMALRV
jgi:septum formation inhibitor-activating ATPase MinD